MGLLRRKPLGCGILKAMRVLGRRVYWCWYGEVLLEGGLLLRMTGDAAVWLSPGEQVFFPSTMRPSLGLSTFPL